jgi:predicted nucleotidyltransferase
MSARIAFSEEEVKSFCRRWEVRELALFGSVLRDDFRSDSDVDVLVTFQDGAGWSLLDIVSMKDELGRIFGREIDIVEKDAVRNPFMRQSILSSEVLYAA